MNNEAIYSPLLSSRARLTDLDTAMPALKRLERSATVGFCPQAGFMAAGTVAGAIDMSFSTASTLDVRGWGDARE